MIHSPPLGDCPSLVPLSHLRSDSSQLHSTSFFCGIFQKLFLHPVCLCNDCLTSHYASLSAQFSQGIRCSGDRRQKCVDSTYWSRYKLYWWLWFENLFQARLSPDTLFGEEKWAHTHLPCPHTLWLACTVHIQVLTWCRDTSLVPSSLLFLPFKPSWCQIASFWACVQEASIQITLMDISIFT